MKEEWEGLNLPDLIALLEPVPEPPPVSMVPQTAGWLWLGLFLLLLVSLLIWQIWRIWRRNTYRREALKELEHCKGDAAAMARLVRRTALAAYPRAKVASLYGREWLAFLDKAYGGDGFSNGPGKALEVATYGKELAGNQASTLIREWIKTHRRENLDA